MRQARNDESREVGHAPDKTVPNWPVIERVVEIDQEWRAGLKFVCDRRDGCLRVRHVVKDAERKGKVERPGREWYVGDAVQMIGHIMRRA
jgi:hypothetical protein